MKAVFCWARASLSFSHHWREFRHHQPAPACSWWCATSFAGLWESHFCLGSPGSSQNWRSHTRSIGLPSQNDGNICRAIDCPSFLDVPSKEKVLKQGFSNCFRERKIWTVNFVWRKLSGRKEKKPLHVAGERQVMTENEQEPLQNEQTWSSAWSAGTCPPSSLGARWHWSACWPCSASPFSLSWWGQRAETGQGAGIHGCGPLWRWARTKCPYPFLFGISLQSKMSKDGLRKWVLAIQYCSITKIYHKCLQN